MNFKLFGIGLFITILVGAYIYFADFSYKDNSSVFVEKISLLESKLDSLDTKKDSIKTVIDSTHIKIVTNEKHYKKVVNTIIFQPMDSDYLFIKSYLRQYRIKKDSNNLCRTSETF